MPLADPGDKYSDLELAVPTPAAALFQAVRNGWVKNYRTITKIEKFKWVSKDKF